jgi:hypothetical protein
VVIGLIGEIWGCQSTIYLLCPYLRCARCTKGARITSGLRLNNHVIMVLEGVWLSGAIFIPQKRNCSWHPTGPKGTKDRTGASALNSQTLTIFQNFKVRMHKTTADDQKRKSVGRSVHRLVSDIKSNLHWLPTVLMRKLPGEQH